MALRDPKGLQVWPVRMEPMVLLARKVPLAQRVLLELMAQMVLTAPQVQPGHLV